MIILGSVTVTRVVAAPDIASILLSAHSILDPDSADIDILRPNEHKHEVQAAQNRRNICG